MRVPFYSIYSLALVIKQSRESALLELVSCVSSLYPELPAIAQEDEQILGRIRSIQSSNTEDELGIRIEREAVSYLVLNVWESKSKDTGAPLANLTDSQRGAIESALRYGRFIAQVPAPHLSSGRAKRFDAVVAGRRPYVYFFLKAEAHARSKAADRLEELVTQFGTIEKTLADDKLVQLSLDDEAHFLEECDRQLGRASAAA